MLICLILAIVIYAAIKIVGAASVDRFGTAADRMDSLQILKIRYARGEISEGEFLKMKDTLD